MAMSKRTTFLGFAAWFSLASAACAQRLTVGVVGGTNVTSNFLTRDFTTPADMFGNPANRFQFMTGSKSFIFGALVEIRLSEGFSIEANVLSRPMKSTIIFTEFPVGGINKVSKDNFTGVKAWEFPVMLKYSLPSSLSAGRFSPFLEAGPSFRTQENTKATEPSQFGLSVGAGATFHLGRIRIAPGFRYTRWERESIYPRYATKPDQVEFLTSIAYETDSGSLHLGGRKLELGAVVGFPLMGGFLQPDSVDKIAERTRYLAGPTAQMNLMPNISVEVDAIYNPLRADQVAGLQERFSVITWQFPVLAKYRWTREMWAPFAEVGPSFRLAGNLNGYDPSHYGITFGGGLEMRTHGVRLFPALRYTRWVQDPLTNRNPAGVQADYSRTNVNAVELVIGVSF
jgi:Outer membrane protein beta-barrel domain